MTPDRLAEWRRLAKCSRRDAVARHVEVLRVLKLPMDRFGNGSGTLRSKLPLLTDAEDYALDAISSTDKTFWIEWHEYVGGWCAYGLKGKHWCDESVDSTLCPVSGRRRCET